MARARVPSVRTSERTTFRSCRQKWFWGYRMGLVRKGPPHINFWFGTGIHLALAEHYQRGLKRGDPRKVWERYCADEYEVMKSWDGDDSEYVNAQELGAAMLDGYLAEYQDDEHMDIISTEQTRRIPVFDERGRLIAHYLYTMDGVYRDRADHGKIKLLEHKTAAMINLRHLTLDDQAGSYLAFETLKLRESGVLKEHESIQDITYNILRKALPKEDDRPRNAEGFALNKDGTVSKNQNKQAPLFVREDIPRSREARLQLVDRFVAEVREMNECRADHSRIYKNPQAGPMGCVSCPFLDLCEIHEEGGDMDDFIAWNFRKQNPYEQYRKPA